MSVSQKSAEQCLVAACACVSLTFMRDESFKDWIDVIRAVVLDTAECADPLKPLHYAAVNLTSSPPGLPFDNALVRLRCETEAYYRQAAAHRHNIWRESASNVGQGA